ncbi:MAG: pilin [Clostridia bacterium]
MKKLLFIITLFIYIILILSPIVLGATPKLVNKLNDAFKDIEGWIIKISTPAAAVAVCTGALMRKFSFGDEEKIRTGKKLITGSLFSYAFILAIDLILSAIQSLIG